MYLRRGLIYFCRLGVCLVDDELSINRYWHLLGWPLDHHGKAVGLWVVVGCMGSGIFRDTTRSGICLALIFHIGRAR